MQNNPAIRCALQEDDFNTEDEQLRLREAHPNAGAIVTFTGLVRNLCKDGEAITGIELITYPQLAQQQIEELASSTFARFDIQGITVIHRHGLLRPSDQIVFVAVASAHRAESFAAADMLMDHLKSSVAFWKKEHFRSNAESGDNDQQRWINVKESDVNALKRWD